MILSQTEENYLKTIFKLEEKFSGSISTNAIAEMIKTTAASVTDMVKRLRTKKLVDHEKYKGTLLTKKGSAIAKNLIRKHRLWESFLVEKLNFNWDEVHDMAEQLEHIKSKILTKRLDEFLDHPKFDPHGDPIPDENGKIVYQSEILLSELKQNQTALITGVKDHSSKFLQYLETTKLVLGAKIKVLDVVDYDSSLLIQLNNKKEFRISEKVGNNLFVKSKSVI
ncbi:MAG: metal-dependent transcriptional regulator [Bacteroidetes bacterium]|nr:metal-dependent transcriptional regulator [Bacteroidota bacterium]